MSEQAFPKNGCPVPGCEIIPPHVPYVTDFCHACGGSLIQKMGGVLCSECEIFIDSIYVGLPKEWVST